VLGDDFNFKERFCCRSAADAAINVYVHYYTLYIAEPRSWPHAALRIAVDPIVIRISSGCS